MAKNTGQQQHDVTRLPGAGREREKSASERAATRGLGGDNAVKPTRSREGMPRR